MEYTAEILCLGNELLIGRTINKNAAEIALALTKVGFSVTRETTVRDDLTEASDVLRDILHRKPHTIVITGGLGPTHDDIQLEIISNAVQVDLELNSHAVEMMKMRYQVTEADFSKYLTKMAMLPKGATALQNSQGAAPGVETVVGDTIIYSLPGVPREMNAILQEEIIPRITEKFNFQAEMIEFGFNLRGVGESRITDVTNKIRKEYPSVGFKSHPKNDDTGYWMGLHTYQIGIDEELVKEACEAWFQALDQTFDVQLSEIQKIFSDDFEPE